MFLIALEETLDPRAWEIVGEYLLGKEPARVDAVVIRRHGRAVDPPLPRMHTVLDGLRAHNVVHLKGSTDELERTDAVQVLHYATGYLLAARLDDPGELALRVVAPALTPRFVGGVTAMGGSLAPTAEVGVHEGRLGPFALRVIETSLACEIPHEQVLFLFSPRFLRERRALAPVDDAERRLYNRLYRCIEQLARSPEAAMTKDVELVRKRFAEDLADLLPLMDLEVVLQKVSPEQRLAGLSAVDRILALPDDVLHGLSEDYVVGLAPEVQAAVRMRRGR